MSTCLLPAPPGNSLTQHASGLPWHDANALLHGAVVADTRRASPNAQPFSAPRLWRAWLQGCLGGLRMAQERPSAMHPRRGDSWLTAPDGAPCGWDAERLQALQWVRREPGWQHALPQPWQATHTALQYLARRLGFAQLVPVCNVAVHRHACVVHATGYRNLYLNHGAPARSIGHEAWHLVEQTQPAFYRSCMALLRSSMRPERVTAAWQQDSRARLACGSPAHSRAAFEEERIADMAGHATLRRAFLDAMDGVAPGRPRHPAMAAVHRALLRGQSPDPAVEALFIDPEAAYEALHGALVTHMRFVAEAQAADRALAPRGGSAAAVLRSLENDSGERMAMHLAELNVISALPGARHAEGSLLSELREHLRHRQADLEDNQFGLNAERLEEIWAHLDESLRASGREAARAATDSLASVIGLVNEVRQSLLAMVDSLERYGGVLGPASGGLVGEIQAQIADHETVGQQQAAAINLVALEELRNDLAGTLEGAGNDAATGALGALAQAIRLIGEEALPLLQAAVAAINDYLAGIAVAIAPGHNYRTQVEGRAPRGPETGIGEHVRPQPGGINLFEDLGVGTLEQFQALIKTVLDHPDMVVPYSRGVTAYWQRQTNTLVTVSERDPNNSRVYRLATSLPDVMAARVVRHAFAKHVLGEGAHPASIPFTTLGISTPEAFHAHLVRVIAEPTYVGEPAPNKRTYYLDLGNGLATVVHWLVPQGGNTAWPTAYLVRESFDDVMARGRRVAENERRQQERARQSPTPPHNRQH